MKPQNKAIRERLPNGDTAQREQGAILLIVLVLIFAVTLAVMAYLYLNKNNTLIASNLAVQNAAQEATDAGLQNAAAWLNGLTTWPEILASGSSDSTKPYFFLTPPSGYYSASTTSSSSILAPTNPSFWQQCVANSTCYSIGTVSYGAFSYQVEYVVFPTGGISTQLEGYEQSQTGNSTGGAQSRYYVVFVHTMRTNGGGLGVTVQAVLRKVMAS
ncbi:MAG: hypothetical protein AB7U63_12080 [Porticoccaceae bacterium]